MTPKIEKMKEALPNIYTEHLTPELSFDMILVEGGSFMMGSEDEDAYDREKSVPTVHVPTFYMAKFPVTQDIWIEVIGYNPSIRKGERRPAENLPWKDIKLFFQKLNQHTERNYRLPTEVEWEYSARGGRQSEGYRYSGSDKLKEVGWYKENAEGETHEVGVKMGNELGLFDISGNIWEWVEDHFHDEFDSTRTDGSVWQDLDRGAFRTLRGGGYLSDASSCEVSKLRKKNPIIRGTVGFRLALSADLVG